MPAIILVARSTSPKINRSSTVSSSFAAASPPLKVSSAGKEMPKKSTIVSRFQMSVSVKLSLAGQQSADTAGCPSLGVAVTTAFKVIVPLVHDGGKIKTNAP